MRNTINRTANFGLRVAAAGAMSAVLVALPAAKAVAAPTAHSAHGNRAVSVGVLDLKGGTASTKLDPAAVAALASFGVSLSANAGDGSAAVPVTDTWNASIARGAIAWSSKTVNGATAWKIRAGALSLGKASLVATKGSNSLAFGSISARFVSGLGGKVSAKVDGKRPIDLVRITDPSVNATTRTVTASLVLTPRAAKGLNKLLSTTAFKAGAKFGTVSVTAPPAA